MRKGTSGFCPGPMLFSDFINDLDKGMERMLSKFADDTKLKGIADSSGERLKIQRILIELNIVPSPIKYCSVARKLSVVKVQDFGTRLVVAGSAKVLVRRIWVFWSLHSSHLQVCLEYSSSK